MTISIKPQMPSQSLAIGDVFYVIRCAADNNNHFNAKCPVCNGERKLTVNGVTFDCPVCRTRNIILSINQRVVRRVRVYSIKQETTYNDWKASNYRDVKIGFYHKEGRGNNYYSNDNFTFDLSVKTIAEHLNKQPHGEDYFNEEYSIFDDYKLAVAVADILTARELKKVEQYNAENGTNFVATFDAKNDVKSN